MKSRILALFLVLVIFMVSVPQFALAAPIPEEGAQIVYLENGDYIVVTTREYETRATQTKTANRDYTYTNSSGDVAWVITLSATFTYTGTSATCTASSVNVTINDSNWYTVSKTAGKSGNTATADVTMGKKFLGITISKTDYTVTLTCSPTGTLS